MADSADELLDKFDVDEVQLQRIRNEHHVVQGFEDAVERFMPLVALALDEAVDMGSAAVPGGPLAVMGVKIGGSLLKDAIEKWAAKKASKP